MDIFDVFEKLINNLTNNYKLKFKELKPSNKLKTLLLGFLTLIITILFICFMWNVSREFEENLKLLIGIISGFLILFSTPFIMIVFIDKKGK